MQLAGEGQVLRGELSAIAWDGLQPWASQAAARSEARVTIVDPSGVVLADSEQNPSAMENHSTRPEVLEAYGGRIGVSTRLSATINRDLFYVAIPITYMGQPGFVLRLAAPLRDLTEPVAAMRWRILRISGGAAALALLLAYWFSRGWSRRVLRLQRFADNLVQARFSEEISRDGEDELGALAASLGRMAAQLRDYVNQLSLESARRDAILASMVEGVLAVDSEMRVIFCNPAFARAVNAQPPIPERMPVLELVRDPAFLDILTRALATGQSIVERMRMSDSSSRSYEVHATPLVGSPRPAALAVLHDVTELERLERVRKDFVANVSHELRTPLTAIGGYAETLLDGALEDPENNRKFVEIIRAHSIRLNNIATDLLALSELESGRKELAPEPISLRSALESAARAVESEAQIRRVAVVWDEFENTNVLGHRIRLEQAFVNLLDNAVKFNRPGGQVRIGCIRFDGKVKVSISDSGIGIPYEDQSRIFERFYRVDKARSREVGGTGLGLAIVRHVVERMDGLVAVDSTLGKGSTFTVTLPIAPAG